VHALGRLEFDAGGQPLRIVGTVQDISHRKKAEADIRHLAYFDPLTGLPNRRMLLERLSNALHDRALDGQHGALMFIDLDHFKDLNDSLGHDQGDALLQMVALRLLGCVADNDTVSRLGGDEFVLLLSWLVSPPQETAMQTAERVAQRVIAALGRPYTLGGTSHTSTPSIGITLFAGEGLGVDEVIKRADVAMYQAKAAGRNTLRFFDPRIQAETAQRLQLAEDLRDAIAHDQLSLQYQPQHDDAGRLVGAEALLRWTHPVRGPVSPAVFIPLAEQVGLIESLGQWVLHTACQQLKTWLQHPDLQGWHQGFSMAVNVSAHQFRSRTFVEDVQREVLRAGLTPGLLKLELTESLMVHDVEDIIEKMKAIRPLGVHFSLDDFGTGYSSLTYLKRLPLDQLKIDQSFVRDLLTDPNDAGIARTVVALGQTLGLEVIAEGVETLEQRQCLADMGCRVYQGYLFSRPIKPDEFMAYALSCIK
jgi:diguanylate cyclase (GGDEF)-like protein